MLRLGSLQGQGSTVSNSCCSDCASARSRDAGYRRVLWAVLAVNAAMFAVEIGAGLAAGSASLQADALDFLGDAANYAISLFVVGMALRYRAMAALAKGATMFAFGLWVIAVTIWHVLHGTLPHAFTMGAVGSAALLANAASFALLWAYRDGDSNMRSAWICTRNDVLGNLAVLLAAIGVFGTGTGWPDVIVAAIMSALALQGAAIVFRQAMGELRQDESRLPVARRSLSSP
jgi:Co/Zn/Cd efflux system component